MANWGQAGLAYLYSFLDTLSQGTLPQLVGLWKLLEISSLFSFFVALVLLNLAIIFTRMLLRFKGNCISCPCKLYLCFHLINYIHSSCKLSSCKLYPFILQTAPIHLANCHLVNCIHSFLSSVGPFNTVL